VGLPAPVVLATVSSGYWAAVVVAAGACAGLCVAARRRPGPWCELVAVAIGAILLVDACSFVVAEIVAGTFSPATDLPLALCDMAVLVAAAACWTGSPLLVEVTWFWGMAGTLQGLLTPDLDAGASSLVFWQYVVGHAAIVLAALFLVVGMGHHPRPKAGPRVLGITVVYTALVGIVDGLFGADYMFLRQPPPEWTLLRLLGPWPWYTVSALGVAIVLVTVLDAPFWAERRAATAAAADRTRQTATPAPATARPAPETPAPETAAPETAAPETALPGQTGSRR